MKKHFLFILTLLFANNCFCQAVDDSSFLKINFKAESTIKVNFKNFNDTILLSSRFGNFFPNDELRGPEIKLYGDGTEFITLKIQIPQKVELNFSDYISDSQEGAVEENDSGMNLDVTCFLVPFDTLEIDLDYSRENQQNQSIIFRGKYAEISKYYQDKASYFPGKNFNYMKGILANTQMDLDSFKNSIDSLTGIELSFLNDYCSKNELPEWFTDYERSDLNYFAFCSKLGEPFYMKNMYGSTQQVPEDYYSFTNDLPLENGKAILSVYYYESLRDYFMTIWEPAKYKNPPAGKSNSPNSKVDFAEYSRSLFSPYISDVLLARFLDVFINLNYINDDDYIMIMKWINDTSFKNYLKSHYANREILKKGDEAPSFYLKNENGTYLSSGSFRDSIIYISFWFSGCKPCIKEFPDENRLVDIFKNEKVKIISICMDTEEDNWRYMIQKYELKTLNLYATGNWEEILKEGYDISGFPHYVLIDGEGRIIENKCVRPSQGAEQLIRNALGN